MKRFLLFIFIFIIGIISMFNASFIYAEIYQNIITDDTSIVDDFKVLGLDINDYYESTKYDYNKWYCVAMSESYLVDDNYDIQTYFYLYNPVKFTSSQRSMMSNFTLRYSFVKDGIEYTFDCKKLEYDEEHLIYKVKGFTYNYVSYKEIYLLDISYVSYSSGSKYNYSSTFKATNNHSKLNGLTTELSFDSMLVLEEYNVVPIKVEYDDENSIFETYWDYMFNSEEPKGVYVYFYNFNFPDHINYDDVIYAKFEYDLVLYSRVEYGAGCIAHSGDPDVITEISRSRNNIQEYYQDSNEVYLKDSNVKLEFPTFYLGNRIIDNQFGTLVMDPYINLFDYDCSVLLGSTYELCNVFYRCEDDINLIPVCGAEYTYDQMEEIEILELHYSNDGITYKCQVSGGNLSPGDPGYEEPIEPEEPDLFDKIKSWFNNWMDEKTKGFYDKIKPVLMVLGIGICLFVFYWLIKGIVAIAKLIKDITNL